MAFVRHSGEPKIEYFEKTASTDYSNGALVYDDGSRYIIPADATSGDHIGIILQEIASTDSDYASATKVMVDVAGEDDIFEVDCGGAATAALLNTYIDLTDSVTADETASAKDVLLVVGIVSASKVLVKIASRKNILRTATT